MKVLVAAVDYPNNNGWIGLMFIHIRNLYYQEHGINVTVLNFAAKNSYMQNGIKVLSLSDYKHNTETYDILVCHASNLKNHYLFLKKYGTRFLRFVFVFHGHEVLSLIKEYPEPFPFFRKRFLLKKTLVMLYDVVKFTIWHRYFLEVKEKSDYVFVSNWLLNKFMKYLRINKNDFGDATWVVNNSVGRVFENQKYNINAKKDYDFVSIRSNLDNPKYGADIIIKLAEKNPYMKFLLIGKGKIFDFIQKPNNLVWIDRHLIHSEMLELIDKSRCALMPTREDTQGVMSCELVAYGIPLITSDIEVCREIFNGMPNVLLIDNNNLNIDLCCLLKKLTAGLPYEENKRYYAENTTKKEIDIILNKN